MNQLEFIMASKKKASKKINLTIKEDVQTETSFITSDQSMYFDKDSALQHERFLSFGKLYEKTPLTINFINGAELTLSSSDVYEYLQENFKEISDVLKQKIDVK